MENNGKNNVKNNMENNGNYKNSENENTRTNITLINERKINDIKVNKKKRKKRMKRDNIFKNADIYVVRVYNGNDNDKIRTSMSKPCKNCISFLRSIGIKRVFYSTGDIYEGGWKCEKISDIISDHISIGNRINSKH